MRTLLLSIASLGLLAGCTAGHAAPASSGSLNGTEWMRTDDTNASPHNATISFTEREASGYTGCTTWLSTPSRNGDALHFGGVRTEHACHSAEVAEAAQRNFLNALHSVRRGVIENGELVFYDGRGAQVARFDQTNPPSVPENTAPEAPSQPTPAPSTTP